MRFRITYRTEYRYSEPVRDNLNVLRVKPATTQHQTVDDFALRVEPETRLHQYRDYFGSEVIEFGVTEPHDRLAVEARMHVTTSEPELAPPGSWEGVSSRAYQSEGGEFRLHSELPPQGSGFASLIESVRAPTPKETVLAVGNEIPDRFEYRSGSTFVGSTVSDLLEGGAGVCQDFVHLGLMVLREVGIAARYVSGYLFAGPRTAGRTRLRCRPTPGSRRSCPTETRGRVGSRSTPRTGAGRARRT